MTPTTGPRTAGAIARRAIDRGAGLILAAGGDGTINEVAEGMLHSEVPLGILPGGTANVLAMEMKLGSRLERVAERLDRLCPRRVSVGHVTCDGGQASRHFLLMAGAGLDAHIVYHVDGELKARVGKFAYWAAGWSMLGRRLAQIEVELCGQKRLCSFALASKVRNYGGDFRNRPLGDAFRGRLRGGPVRRPQQPAVREVFPRDGAEPPGGNEGRDGAAGRHLKLTCASDPRVYLQIDGEFAGNLPAELRIVPDALTVLAPAEYGEPQGQPVASGRDCA